MSKIGKQIIAALEEALADARGEPTGIRKHIVTVPAEVDVKEIRRRLRMSQRVFADRFGFSLEAIQDWERGRQRPEGVARALLKVIDKRPDAVLEALGEDDDKGRGQRAERLKGRRAAAVEMPRRQRRSKLRSAP